MITNDEDPYASKIMAVLPEIARMIEKAIEDANLPEIHFCLIVAADQSTYHISSIPSQALPQALRTYADILSTATQTFSLAEGSDLPPGKMN